MEQRPASLHQLEAELAALRLDLERRERALQAELQVAVRVHRSLLPQPVRHPLIDVDTRYVPVDRLGGDYCQVLFPEEACCYVTMCDVTGRGIGSALLATRVSSEVRHLVLDRLQPMDIVEAINQFTIEHFLDTGRQLSFFVARLDLRNGILTYSGAGHPGPLLIRHGTGPIEVLKSENLLIGAATHCLGDRPEGTRHVRRGDRLLFFTDGLTESMNPNGNMLGTNGVVEIATTSCAGSFFDLANCILERVEAFRMGPPKDDITLITAELK